MFFMLFYLNNIEPYLNILNNIVLKSNEYFMRMTKLNEFYEINKEFPYIMYSIRSIKGHTRWLSGV